MSLDERTSQMARQGVRYPVVQGHIVADSKTCKPLPQDGASVGEILIKGNTVMLGYLKDAKATAEAFAGGWMHTGDLAVWHESNYIEIKDRKKDIIISGGENISSVEVEMLCTSIPRSRLPRWLRVPTRGGARRRVRSCSSSQGRKSTRRN